MEYRSQTAIGLLIALALPLAAEELRFDVRHERALRDHPGVLIVDGEGVTYQQVLTPKQEKRKKQPQLERVRFAYQDIQQLWIAPDKLVLVTYQDRKWFLGVDKEFEFFARGPAAFEKAYAMLQQKLDERLVAALADPQPDLLWEIPAKLTGAFYGSEGVLQVGPDRVVYKTGKPRHSRTWRYQDIENISTSGPFEFTLTSFERAKLHYGSRKSFQFQLKRRLDQRHYELLWRRLNQDKGLTFLKALSPVPPP